MIYQKFPSILLIVGATACVALASCRGMVNKGAVIHAQELFDKGDYDRALHQLQVADSSYLEANLLKARSYEAKGDKMTARSYYSELVRSHPDSAEGIVARNRLKAL
ncbi:MAG: tetratricopeptide repeat protein [Luteolibacter sp.]